ncbi:DUF4157 domain-containing protein [Ktedonobacter racemifer]|uniref:eCIS core domain-containing protein n=1 Tax=Ktedonobacter racemifer DSM 44963 TaxID=485913 RepID=D6TXD6_KTERA|nr:DUF4157 domain-containing protein [Ktedonobacter racemifer]EFH84869.1 hypothetical protein Krac_5984 [Ktedonobacter racemifer DSM 44963]
MRDRAYAKTQAQQKTLSARSSLLQRTCACGQHIIAGDECSVCRNQRSTLLHSQRTFEPPSAPVTVPGSAPAQEQGPSFSSAFDRASRFGHDFSRIPIHAPAVGVLQTKLAINQPGDDYEQEADRLSDQVMRMPEPHLQRACACGGACPKCQTKQPGWEHENLRTKRVQAGDMGQVAAPPIVQEVLLSPGQPLDPATRAFMEPRFGHDFSRVQVHTGGRAAESARAVNAAAYTVGQDIVFGPEEYAPHAPQGQRILAHELAHVIQQERGGTGSASPMIDPSAAHEREAEAATSTLLESESPVSVRSATRIGMALAPPTKPTPALTPEDLVNIVLNQRGFTSTAPRPSGRDPETDLPVFTGGGTNRLPSSDPGATLGMGFDTHAAIQVVGPDGTQVASDLGAFLGRRQTHAPSGAHAEAQAVFSLRLRLANVDVRGGKLMVGVDQMPCGPEKEDCLLLLRTYAREKGLELEVYGPVRPKMPRGNQPLDPSDKATTKHTATTSAKAGVPEYKAELLYAEKPEGGSLSGGSSKLPAQKELAPVEGPKGAGGAKPSESTEELGGVAKSAEVRADEPAVTSGTGPGDAGGGLGGKASSKPATEPTKTVDPTASASKTAPTSEPGTPFGGTAKPATKPAGVHADEPAVTTHMGPLRVKPGTEKPGSSKSVSPEAVKPAKKRPKTSGTSTDPSGPKPDLSKIKGKVENLRAKGTQVIAKIATMAKAVLLPIDAAFELMAALEKVNQTLSKLSGEGWIFSEQVRSAKYILNTTTTLINDYQGQHQRLEEMHHDASELDSESQTAAGADVFGDFCIDAQSIVSDQLDLSRKLRDDVNEINVNVGRGVKLIENLSKSREMFAAIGMAEYIPLPEVLSIVSGEQLGVRRVTLGDLYMALQDFNQISELIYGLDEELKEHVELLEKDLGVINENMNESLMGVLSYRSR